MLGFVIGILVLVLMIFMLIKKMPPQAVLLTCGIILMFLAHILGIASVLPEDKTTGFFLFDIFTKLGDVFSSTMADLGLTVMVVGAFAEYMEKIGASEALVDIAIGPLRKIKRPYLLLAFGYALGQIINIFIPSATGLALLLMATLYPMLISIGLSKLSATAMIVTTACLDLGIGSGNAILAANTSGLAPSEYFVKYQIPVSVIAITVVSVLTYFTAIYFDKKEGTPFQRTVEENVILKREEEGKVPKIYAILLILPLALSLVFSPLIIKSIQIEIVAAMLFSVAMAILFELIRLRNVGQALGGLKLFFKAMGVKFAGIVSMIIAGQFFAKGLMQIGLIDFIISKAQNANLGVVPMTIIMVGIITFAAIVMGSGNAPFFAFASLAPDIAEPLGVQTVLMAMPMQLASGYARTISPIASIILAPCGISEVDPVSCVKRTAIPMIGGLISMTLATFILF